jgi:hypothetical protein
MEANPKISTAEKAARLRSNLRLETPGKGSEYRQLSVMQKHVKDAGMYEFMDQNRITIFNGSVSNGDGADGGGSFEDGEKLMSGRGTSMIN